MEQTVLPFPPPKKPWSGQLEIAECGTNVSLRYSFQIPVYGGKKGDKLAGLKLIRVVRSNLVAQEDLELVCGSDLNKLAQAFMRSTIEGIVRMYKLPGEAFITFKGIDVCYHRPCTKPALDDPRWV